MGVLNVLIVVSFVYVIFLFVVVFLVECVNRYG